MALTEETERIPAYGPGESVELRCDALHREDCSEDAATVQCRRERGEATG